MIEFAHPIPDTETRIEFSFTADLGISAAQARRSLTQFFLDELSMFMRPQRTANLIVNGDEDIVWRFPIMMTWGTLGTLGEIGVVDVDAINGDLRIDLAKRQELKINASHLVTVAEQATIG